jgi:hypothetical protein
LPPLLDPTQIINLGACKGSPALGKGVNGHHENWATVTYEGAAHWVEHSSWGTDKLGADDDYNIKITREDQSAYHAGQS